MASEPKRREEDMGRAGGRWWGDGTPPSSTEGREDPKDLSKRLTTQGVGELID